MTSPFRALNDQYRAYDVNGHGRRTDPGNTVKVLTVDRQLSIFNLVSTTGAQTRTLAAPSKPGVIVTFCLESITSGTLTITTATAFDQAGNDDIVFGDAGDFVTLMSVEVVADTFMWRVVAFDGVTGPTLELSDIDVDTINVSNYLGMIDDVNLILGTGGDVNLNYNGTYLEGGPTTGMWAGAPSPADPQYHVTAHEFFDDFRLAPLDAGLVWHEEDDGATGTNAATDAANGIANVVTTAQDNDYHAISSTNEQFLFATGKKLWFEARFKLAESATNESAWWFGLTDTLTTGGIQANAAGPLASYDGFLIWKDEGTMSVDS